MPAGSVTGRSLTLVITIMCFLASLTAGAVNMMYQSASQWMRDIATEITVQVEAKERVDVDKLVASVAGFQPVMPPYQGRVNEEQLMELIAYIKGMGRSDSADAGTARPGAPPKPTKAEPLLR